MVLRNSPNRTKEKKRQSELQQVINSYKYILCNFWVNGHRNWTLSYLYSHFPSLFFFTFPPSLSLSLSLSLCVSLSHPNPENIRDGVPVPLFHGGVFHESQNFGAVDVFGQKIIHVIEGRILLQRFRQTTENGNENEMVEFIPMFPSWTFCTRFFFL